MIANNEVKFLTVSHPVFASSTLYILRNGAVSLFTSQPSSFLMVSKDSSNFTANCSEERFPQNQCIEKRSMILGPPEVAHDAVTSAERKRKDSNAER